VFEFLDALQLAKEEKERDIVEAKRQYQKIYDDMISEEGERQINIPRNEEVNPVLAEIRHDLAIQVHRKIHLESLERNFEKIKRVLQTGDNTWANELVAKFTAKFKGK
jgi:hypothetical protein